MELINSFLFGIKQQGKALLFIKENKLYWFTFFPFLLMGILYYLGTYLLKLPHRIDPSNIQDIFWNFILLTIEVSISLIIMEFTKYMVVIFLSPLLAFLSQKTEQYQTGKSYAYNLQQLKTDVQRALKITMRNIMWKYALLIPIYAVGFFMQQWTAFDPTPYLAFFIGAYFYGFSFIDYTNERHQKSVNESILIVRKNRGFVFVTGAIFSLLIYVPVDLSLIFGANDLGWWETLSARLLHILFWIIASFAPILAIVSATLGMVATSKK